VKIKRLRAFVFGLPRNSRLKEIILSEDDELEVQEFLVKMDVWLKLFRMEFS